LSLLFVIAAYLVGSISPSFLLFRILRGGDIRDMGSGNPGATNVLRSGGVGPALCVLLLDIAKGALPVLVARRAGLAEVEVACVAFAAVLGHIFSLFLRFRGGKGVATAAGAFGALNLSAMAISALVFVAIVAATRYVSAGSTTAALAFPVATIAVSRMRDVEPPSVPVLAASFAIALLIVAKHRSNIRDLVRGCERKLGESQTREGSS